MSVRFLTLNLLLFLLSGWGVSRSSGTSGRWCSGGSSTRSDVQEKILNILTLKSLSRLSAKVPGSKGMYLLYLSEERGPDWLNIFNSSSLDQGQELIGLGKVSLADSGRKYAVARGHHTVISTESSARMRAA